MHVWQHPNKNASTILGTTNVLLSANITGKPPRVNVEKYPLKAIVLLYIYFINSLYKPKTAEPKTHTHTHTHTHTRRHTDTQHFKVNCLKNSEFCLFFQTKKL